MEDRKLYAGSFEHYAKANAALRLANTYDPESTAKLVAASRALFTNAFFASRKDAGCKVRDPIFVLSLPRSGSTLVEQILASHSQIEGAGELADIQALARRFRREPGGYPGALAALEPAALAALGEAYIENTRVHRKFGRPFFVDKKPANLHHIGLIHSILPNAKIVDVRRHPVACCLSGFKNHFTTARPNLAEFGRFYRDYVALLAHFDSVLPGKVHRVFYEDLVADPESQTRRLLDYLGLPFEDACLRFYETKRTVLTPSSEQVRRPDLRRRGRSLAQLRAVARPPDQEPGLRADLLSRRTRRAAALERLKPSCEGSMMAAPALNPVFSSLPTTIFTHMSALATAQGAVNLGQGFPDEDGPLAIREARRARAGRRAEPISAMRGRLELRKALAGHAKRFYGFDLDPDTDIVVTSGATEALTASDHGDGRQGRRGRADRTVLRFLSSHRGGDGRAVCAW